MNVENIYTIIKEKRSSIIILVIFFFLLGGFLIYYFYFRIDESELNKLASKIQENKVVNKYISGVSFFREETEDVITYKGIKSYQYTLSSLAENDFEKTTVKEKYIVFMEIAKIIKEESGSTLIKCGYKKYCDVSQVQSYIMEGETNSYSFDMNTNEITHSYINDKGLYLSEKLSSAGIPNKSNGTNTSNNTSPRLEVVEKSGNIDGNYIYVTGAIKNISDISYTFVEIKVSYFDDSGNILDTDSTYLNSSDPLMPNERKSFSLMTQMVGQKYTKYKIQVVNYNVD
ncbi:FxLYD domain-containing protein [Neobacillus drentensis]|uniref:FxLYD domain-containing protein n=1 Tax=Neobacillus drentensis TaxID=220684 RepID=UPI002FFEC79E